MSFSPIEWVLCHVSHVDMCIGKHEVSMPSLGNFKGLTLILGPLYIKSQGKKNLGPTLSIFGLQIGPKLLINARTLMSRY
jgi:hypothetical protein